MISNRGIVTVEMVWDGILDGGAGRTLVVGDDTILFADVLEELGGLVLGNDMQHPKQFRMKAELSQAGKHDVGRVPDSRRDILRPSPEPTGQARGLGLVCSVPDAQSSVIGRSPNGSASVRGLS